MYPGSSCVLRVLSRRVEVFRHHFVLRKSLRRTERVRKTAERVYYQAGVAAVCWRYMVGYSKVTAPCARLPATLP